MSKKPKPTPARTVSNIPVGMYCHDKNGVCPFWELHGEKPDQQNGYCDYIKTGDWEMVHFSLLWDQVKECNINTEDS